MLCSKGIGRSFLTPAMSDYLRGKLDGIGMVNGVRYSLPRYYSDKVFSEEEKRIINEKKFYYHEQRLEEYCKTHHDSLGGRPIHLWLQERQQIRNKIRKSIKNG